MLFPLFRGKLTAEEKALKVTSLVFVYGSLLSGLSNHGRLSDCPRITQAVTRLKYKMVSYRAYPAVCKATRPPATPTEGARALSLYAPVRGEIYRVTPDVLASLDQLEGHPYYYRRETVHVSAEDGRLFKVWMYILNEEEKYPFDVLPQEEIIREQRAEPYDWKLHKNKLDLLQDSWYNRDLK